MIRVTLIHLQYGGESSLLTYLHQYGELSKTQFMNWSKKGQATAQHVYKSESLGEQLNDSHAGFWRDSAFFLAPLR